MIWDDRDGPIAYLITFRTYGSWLHGDERGSVSRFRNTYKTPYLPKEDSWLKTNQSRRSREEVVLSAEQRKCVAESIKDVCKFRNLVLYGVNVRTNHVHVVPSTGGAKPDRLLNAFKANATRSLRESGLWSNDKSPWSDKGSTKYLWNETSVGRAVEYVVTGQGIDLPDFD